MGLRDDHAARGVTAAALTVGFLLVEQRAAEPLMPLNLFKNRVFASGSQSGFIVGFIMFGSAIYIPLFLQVVHGATPTSRGFRCCPAPGPAVHLHPERAPSRSMGALQDLPRHGHRDHGAGLILLSTMDTSTPIQVAWLFMAILGFGMGMWSRSWSWWSRVLVPHEQLGTATSGATFFRSSAGPSASRSSAPSSSGDSTSNLHHFLTCCPDQAGQHQGADDEPGGDRQAATSGSTPTWSTPTAPRSARFLVAAPFGIAAFILSLFLEEVPLRGPRHDP